MNAYPPIGAEEWAILRALQDVPLDPHGLVRRLRDQREGDFTPDPAALFLRLRRLRREGLIVPDPGDPVAGRRRYAATLEGTRVVAATGAGSIPVPTGR